MARGISDIGNGRGILYVVATNGIDINYTESNTLQGARNIRRFATNNAPIAANRSAFATIQIVACAGVGQVTGVGVLATDQLSAAVNCTTATPSDLAADIAANISAFTPAAGYNYSAQAIGDTVILYAPVAAGSTVNGILPVVTVSTPTILFSVTAFINGSENTGSYDGLLGQRFFLDADYGTTGVSGSGTALPNSIANAVEITKYVTVRGTESGFDVKRSTLVTDTITSLDRVCSNTLLYVDTEGGAASDIFAKINASDFVEGDIVIIRCEDPARVITVESAPVTTSTAPNPNIYLSGNIPVVIDSRSKGLILQFTYDTLNNPIFTESARADTISTATLNVVVGNTVFVSKSGDDATGLRQSLKYHFLTVEAAMAVAVAGDIVVVYPGTYTFAAPVSKDGVTLHLMSGTTITGAATVNTIEVTAGISFKVTGNGKITCNDAWAVYQNNATSTLSIECDEILGSTGSGNLTTAILTSSKTYIKAHKHISAGTCASALDIQGGGDVVVDANLVDAATNDVDRNGGAYRILFVGSRTGTGNVTINGNITGRQAGPTVSIQGAATPGVITINGNITQNYTAAAAYNTCCVILANTGADQNAQNVFINGQIQAAGSACGINVSNNTGAGRTIVRGNIYTISGSCILNASSGAAIRIFGDCYQSGVAATNNAVMVGYDDAVNYKFKGGLIHITGRIKAESTLCAPCRINVSTGAWAATSGLIFDNAIVIDNGAFGESVDTPGTPENLLVYQAVANVALNVNVTEQVGATTISALVR